MIKSLIGNGGHAREVMSQMKTELIRFVDDEYWSPGDDKVLPLSKFDSKEYQIMIAIGSSSERFDIYKRLPTDTSYFSFIHPTAIILEENLEIGEGSFIGAYSIITTNVKLGKHTLINRGNQIGHDSEIGDFFSAQPGSIISGNCKLGNCVYLGTNSSIKEKTTICDNVIIGLNSGVVNNIYEKGIYGGVPAKKIS